tara:strand:- start:22054 stop:23427 length:1374 start_codon:yes stop_codon:yes gene_type:complete
MDISKFTIEGSQPIIKALTKIEANHKGFLIVESDKKVIGTITDGDIRRHLLKNSSLDLQINKIINKEFKFINEDTPYEHIYKLLDNDIKFIPNLDNQGRLINFITKENIPERQEVETYHRSKSPVRISFGGGGSDLTNYFIKNNGIVVNATISLYTHSSLIKRTDQKIKINSHDLNQEIIYESYHDLQKSDNNKFELINSLIKTIKPKYGFELYIQSDYPIGTGLGGSATVLSSIIGCFNQLRIDKWTNYEIAEIAFEAERLCMNVSGGWQDQYATVFGGFNFMEFSNEENIIHSLKISNQNIANLEENLVLCYTNTRHESGEIHSDQKKKILEIDVESIVKKNVDLTYKIKNALLKGPNKSFGVLLDKAWNYKKKFSEHITNSNLDNIYKEALENGAIGGKLLGAGGGGYFLFYVPFEKRNNLLIWMENRGLKYTPFRFESEGLLSWSSRLENNPK